METPSRRNPGRPDESSHWRARLHEVIFEADTAVGKAFDVFLLVAIALSVVAVCLESVGSIRDAYGRELRMIEWGFTILFTIEYLLRLIAVRRPLKYARSFFGVVDVLAIIPTYLSIFVAGSQTLLIIRALRLLRIFRVLKLTHFLVEGRMLWAAMRASIRKITIFLGTVVTLMLIAGAAMYLIEGAEGGFTSIPRGIYWAVVTMTTVGYGDIAPKTVLGQTVASFVMILGYGIIAVPTGIVTVNMADAMRTATNTKACPECGKEGHATDAVHCKYCGAKL